MGSFRALVLVSCLAAVSAVAPGMRATVRPAVSSRSSVTTMKTYASLKEAQAAVAAEEAAAAPVKAVKAPREPRPRGEAPKPREPRIAKDPEAKAVPSAPPPAPLTAAQQRSAVEAELAAIQASRKAAEAELKAAQDASKAAKAKVGGSGGVSLPSLSLPKFSAPSVPKFDLSVPTGSSDASPLTGPGAYGLAAGLALGLVPAGALIGARAFLMQRK